MHRRGLLAKGVSNTMVETLGLAIRRGFLARGNIQENLIVYIKYNIYGL
jgi:hypothetical protein